MQSSIFHWEVHLVMRFVLTQTNISEQGFGRPTCLLFDPTAIWGNLQAEIWMQVSNNFGTAPLENVSFGTPMSFWLNAHVTVQCNDRSHRLCLDFLRRAGASTSGWCFVTEVYFCAKHANETSCCKILTSLLLLQACRQQTMSLSNTKVDDTQSVTFVSKWTNETLSTLFRVSFPCTPWPHTTVPPPMTVSSHVCPLLLHDPPLPFRTTFPPMSAPLPIMTAPPPISTSLAPYDYSHDCCPLTVPHSCPLSLAPCACDTPPHAPPPVLAPVFLYEAFLRGLSGGGGGYPWIQFKDVEFEKC